MPFRDVVGEVASRTQLVLAATLSIATLIAVAVLVPYASIPLAKLPHVSAMYGAAAAMINLATFWLLASAPRQSRPHAVIAAAYLYSGLMAVIHVLTFPGAVLPDKPLFGSPHAVSWLFVMWRAGFALFIAWAALADQVHDTVDADASQGPALVAVVAATAAFFASQLTDAAALSTVEGRELFGAFTAIGSYFGAAAAVLANVLIWQRGLFRRSIFVWLTFVMTAEAAGVWVSTFSGGRYTLAWYAIRAEGIVASAVVLVLLAQHFRQLQRSLTESVTVLSKRTEELQAEIHRRERAEQELARAERLKVVGQLGAGLAHDLNNILQVVSGRLSLIQRRLGGSKDTDVEAIRRNMRKAEALTRQLTLLSGRRRTHTERVDVPSVLREVLETVRPLVPSTHSIALLLDARLPHVVLDALELEIAVTNLVTNARDAMPRGGEIRIRALVRPDELVVQVADEGEGISEALRARIFEPFFSTKDVGKGTGLGLAQVAAFVGGAGGHVEVDSTVGKGTTISMAFPLNRAASSLGNTPTADPLPNVGAGRLVLLVDDNDDVREASAQLLSVGGFVVRSVKDAPSALKHIDDGLAPDLVISDIVMPGELDGAELARRLRRRLPALRIVLVTGHSERVEEMTAGGFPVVAKPYDLATLLRIASM